MNVERCKLCDAEFRAEYLKDGKCEVCTKKYPGMSSKEDIKREKDEDAKENEGRLKNIIDKQLDERLKEYGILHTCECGQLFYKTSPAKKKCGQCGKGDK